jgi:methylmalonyl-CoA mutase N-terminal domain/subunit
LGGTQSLHTNSMDEALWLPTEKAVRVALRTQQIIAHESGVADVVDPLGGAYLIEELTDAIEKQAGEYIDKIDQMGGAQTAIEENYIQNEIQQAAYRYQQELEAGEKSVVGVNIYQNEEEITLDKLTVDLKIELEARQRLAALRQKRDGQKVNDLLGRLDTMAGGSENLIPLFVEMVENDITLGEICNVLRKKWGEYRPQ